MKKIFWALAALSLGFNGLLLVGPNPNKTQAAEVVQLKKKKKSKHNYRFLTSSNVSGDNTNGDAGVFANNWLTYQTFYYRRIPVAGLSVGDPFPLRIERKMTSVGGFEEEHWSGVVNYFITEGNVWMNYGSRTTFGPNPAINTFNNTGDYRIFAYNGGTRKKPTKHKALKVYSFSVSGGENDADATGVLPLSPGTTYYYRRISIPGLRVANLGDYRILQRNPYYQGVDGEYWAPATASVLLADDCIYVGYGGKSGGAPFSTLYTPVSIPGDYKFYLYSDGKMKKKKLTKQYVKRYTFNVPGGDSTADKITTDTNGP